MSRLLSILVVLVVVTLAVDRFWPLSALRRTHTAERSEACLIKGNISQDGERIYHMPDQEYYGKTRINEAAGERWFCTEAEAQAAGWRKAKR